MPSVPISARQFLTMLEHHNTQYGIYCPCYSCIISAFPGSRSLKRSYVWSQQHGKELLIIHVLLSLWHTPPCHQVDYWSFGIIIFELITGIRPFFHETSTTNPFRLYVHTPMYTSDYILLLCSVGPISFKQDNTIYMYPVESGHKESDMIPEPYQISK